MKRVKKILYNLGFAALLGLGTVPSLLAIHLLAGNAQTESCYISERLLSQKPDKKDLVKIRPAPLSE